MAPKGKSQHSANFGYDHGKAVLCSNIHQRGNIHRLYTGEDMRLCQCGGHVLQGQLTRGRESWSCKACGRYEILTTKEREDVCEESTRPRQGGQDNLDCDSGGTG
jgi:hypothetical protein